jgi:hypothetical protein
MAEIPKELAKVLGGVRGLSHFAEPIDVFWSQLDQDGRNQELERLRGILDPLARAESLVRSATRHLLAEIG